MLVTVILLSGCAKVSSGTVNQTEPQTEPETTKEIVPEAAISLPCIYLRVAYETDEGFVGKLVAEPDSYMKDNKEINVVIEDGVEICVLVDERTGKFVDAREVTYEPGMLVSVQFTEWRGNAIYPELMYEIDTLWWEEDNT